MATASNLEDLVSCPVCFEVYDSPRILKCLHVLCIYCVRKLQTFGMVECPECRCTSLIHEIKSDFNKQNLVDMYIQQRDEISQLTTVRLTSQQGVNTCESCEEDKIIKWKCEECDGKFICDDCKKAHRLFPGTRNHHLVSVESMTKEITGRLFDSVSACQEKKSELQIEISKGNGLKCNLRKARDLACSSVNKYREQMKKDIDEYHDGFLAGIHESFNEEIKTVDEIQMAMLSDISILDEKNSIVSDLTQSQNIRTLLEIAGPVQHDMKIHLHFTSSRLAKITDLSYGEIPEVKIQGPTQSFKHATKVNIVPPKKNDLLISIQQAKPVNPDLHEEEGHTFNENISQETNIPLHEDNKIDDTDQTYSYLISAQDYIREKVISLQGSSCRLYHLVNSIRCVLTDGIVVYDKDLNEVNRINHGRIEHARAVVVDEHGYYIIACGNKKGLLQFDESGEYMLRITKGSFSDIAIHKNLLYVVDELKCKLLIFVYKFRCWQLHHSFNITHDKGDEFDSLAVTDNFIYITSRAKDCILQYGYDGELIKAHGIENELNGPRLCSVDLLGNMLVADSFNHCLKVCNVTGEWTPLKITRGICRPLDVVTDQKNKFMWVLTAKQIVKFSIVNE